MMSLPMLLDPRQHVPLFPWYGGTEFGPHTKLFDIDTSEQPPPDAKTLADWEWLAFSERVRPNWVPQGDGTYELQFLVRGAPVRMGGVVSVGSLMVCVQVCDTYRPNVENLENPRGYATNNLWEPHPTKKGLWRV